MSIRKTQAGIHPAPAFFESGAGFTLIEVLVVVAILGVILGIGVSILTATFRSSSKTTAFNQVKQNGDFALETITRSMRNAVDVCATGGALIDLIAYNAKVTCGSASSNVELTRFRCTLGVAGSNGSIARYDNGSGTSTQVVSSVKVASCSFSANNSIPKRVTVDFTLQQDIGLGTTSDVTVSIPFHTEITLRNF